MCDEIVYDVERGVVAVTVGIAATVLKDHDGCRRIRFVLRGDINPIFALHAVVDFADVRDFFGESAGGDARLEIGERAESGDVEFAAESGAVHQIIERMEFSRPVYGCGGVPNVRAGKWMHFRARLVVNHEQRDCGSARGEEEIGGVASPGSSFLQILCVEGGDDGVAECRARRFCEFDELRRGGFLCRDRNRCQRERKNGYCDKPSYPGHGFSTF